jgi:hypothetical protein
MLFEQELNRELKDLYKHNAHLQRVAANVEEQDRITQDEITALRVRIQRVSAVALHTP